MSKFNLKTQRNENHQQKRSKQVGASMIEYALIVAAIAAVCAALIGSLGTNTSTKLSRAASQIGS
jgi:Flp pilus assembly pilin Flp